jgi:uncharacterized protein YbjT (DUF2867 family)
MILVTGANGTIGSHVVTALTDAGLPTRALVRSPEKGEAARRRGAEVAVADLADRGALGRALEGVERLFLVTPGNEQQVALETGAIDAAGEAGVRHVVKLSVVGADPASPVRYARSHGQVEAHLRASGLAFTLLQPGDLMDNLLAQAQAIAQTGAFYAAVPPETRIASIDPADIAAVAANALEGSHEGEALPMTGPEAPTRDELAAKVSAATGKEVRFVQVGEDDFRASLLAAGAPEWAAEGLVELARHVFAPGHAAQVLDTVERVTGRPARTWDDWLREHAAALA